MTRITETFKSPSGWAILLLGVVFAVCLPIFLIAGNVGYITNSDWLYSYGWWRNGTTDRTGLPISELNSVSDQIKDYFNNDVERLDVSVNTSQGEFSLFTEREILHMIDVKVLMQGVYEVSIWTGLAMLVTVGLGFAIRQRAFVHSLSSWIRWSVGLSGLVIVFLVVVSLINFGWVFTLFHQLSFANDLWLLDPYRHYLLLLFPQRFFLEATMFIAVLTVIEFAGAYVAARLIEIKLSVKSSESIDDELAMLHKG